MNQILVPTDLSSCANDALRVAADIARKTGDVTIHLLHTYVEHQPIEVHKDVIHDRVKELCEQDFLEGINVETHYIAGKRIWQVLKSSSFNDIDLIVMGTHGIDHNDKWLIGSNTKKVVQFSEVPVLVVKEYMNVNDLDELIYSSTFDNNSIEAFRSINDLIKAFQIHIHLLKVVTPGEFQSTDESERQLQHFAHGVGLDRYEASIYNARSREAGITAFSDDHPRALVAMETEGVFGTGHFFFSRSGGPFLGEGLR